MHILPSLHIGGVERYVTELSLMMPKNTIVLSSGGKLCKELFHHKITHITMDVHTKNPIKLIRNIFLIQKIIKEKKVDIVHAHSRAPAWSSLFASKIAKVPFITTYHARYNSKSLIKKKYNSVMARAARVIAISSFIKNHMISSYKSESWFDKSKIRLIHCGVNCDFFNPNISNNQKIESDLLLHKIKANKNNVIFLLPSRMTYWKGHTTAVEALSHLSDHHKSIVRLIFLDDFRRNTSYKRKVTEMIDKLSVANMISFIPYSPDVVPLFNITDIVLSVSSDPEGFGLITSEAGAMAKPVIGANHGATPEIIIDNKTGWLIEPNNPKALANAMKNAMEMPDNILKKIGLNARDNIVKNFSKETFCKKIIQVYNELLK